jgi:hypothetical protein
MPPRVAWHGMRCMVSSAGQCSLWWSSPVFLPQSATPRSDDQVVTHAFHAVVVPVGVPSAAAAPEGLAGTGR